MGILGLSSFMDLNPHLSQPYRLFDTPVIFDGNNLMHRLYHGNKLDCVYGGDYHKFAVIVRRYFNPFLKCKVKPIVLLDGGRNRTNRKIKRHSEKCEKKINLLTRLANCIAKNVKGNGNTLPINLHEVFKEVLWEMGIPFAQCNFEADHQIASLANHYNCPVLSEDSDFFIFDIRGGFIRLSSVESSVVNKTNNDVNCSYINCRIYYMDNLLSHLPGIDRNVLPLFGTLIGNDYSDPKVFEHFFTCIKLFSYTEPMTTGLNFDARQKKMIELLTWLTDMSLDKAIDQVLDHFIDSDRSWVKSKIVQSVESYSTQKCDLTFVIEGDLKSHEEALKTEGALTTQCGQALPLPFKVSFREGKLTYLFLDIINHHRLFLPLQVEDTAIESGHTCSRYIRQIIYGFLLQHKSCQNNNCRSYIEEFDRRGESPVIEIVVPIFTFKNGSPLPDLCDVYSMKKNSLQRIISLVLNIEVSYILSFPRNLQLLVACINYWLKKCSLKPREELVYALVINLIYFNFILKRPITGKIKNSNASDTGMDAISIAIDTISETDAVSAAENMKKYMRKPTFTWRDRFILHTVHCLSELQSCILFSVCLNMLLDWPFEQPKMHESFSGLLVQHLTKELIVCRSPDLFIAELFGSKSPLNNIFTILKTKILENVSFESYERIDGFRLVTGKNKRIQNHQSKTEDTFKNDTVVFNKFQCLTISD